MGVIYSEKGDIISSFTAKNQDSTDDRWLLQTQLTEAGDVQTVEKYQHSGFASRPPETSKVIIERLSDTYLVSVAEYDGVLNDDLNAGDTRVYSVSSGAVSAFINYLAGGNVEINGNADFAVRYNALQTQFDELKTAFNTHTHSGVASGSSSTGGATPQSAADITTTKVDTVKLP